MQSGTFAKISIWAAIIMTAIVSVGIVMRVAPSAKVPPGMTALGASLASGATTTVIIAPGGAIRAELALTEDAQEQGLSGRDSMPADVGMLFVFPTLGKYGFWMKDMRFPLDVVWIDADKRVAGVDPGLLSVSYPHIFYPSDDVEYVLELDSGEAAALGIATGTQLVF